MSQHFRTNQLSKQFNDSLNKNCYLFCSRNDHCFWTNQFNDSFSAYVCTIFAYKSISVWTITQKNTFLQNIIIMVCYIKCDLALKIQRKEFTSTHSLTDTINTTWKTEVFCISSPRGLSAQECWQTQGWRQRWRDYPQLLSAESWPLDTSRGFHPKNPRLKPEKHRGG